MLLASIEIFYLISKKYNGRGLVTEAAKLVINHSPNFLNKDNVKRPSIFEIAKIPCIKRKIE